MTDGMLNRSAFRFQQGEAGSASLQLGETRKLDRISEFGANPYTDEEEKLLSEIIDSFNERHDTNFTSEDFLRFERVNRGILDDDILDMMLNNPADVVYNAFSQAFFQGTIPCVVTIAIACSRVAAPSLRRALRR
jgi:type I restriction enzyme, R subunit